jgi:hypothetical protein
MAELEGMERADMKFLSSIVVYRIWNAKAGSKIHEKENVARD